MKFNLGDTVRLKSSVSQEMLWSITIGSLLPKARATFEYHTHSNKWSSRANEDCFDVVIRKEGVYYVPETWIELDKPNKPRGHHLTNIFKDDFICSK